MVKKDRIQELFLVLANQRHFVTAKYLSEKLGISVKSIYRLIRQVNDNYLPEIVILSEKGKGYRLNNAFDLTKIQTVTVSDDEEILSATKRREAILEKLLMLSPKSISVISLSQKFFVSEAQILKDRQIIQKDLMSYHLQINSRKGKLVITGDEFNIRQAVAELIPSFSIIDLDRLEFNDDEKIDFKLAKFLQSEISKIEMNLNDKIPYPYNINIFSHLYIMVKRILKSNNPLSLDQSFLDDSIEKSMIYKESLKVIDSIQHFIHQKIPKSEVYYLYRYLISSRFQNNLPFQQVQLFSDRVKEMTMLFFSEFTLLDLKDVNNTSPIFIDLANHISPLIKRLENKIRIKNNMLSEIKTNYRDIFEELARISKKISEEYDLPMLNSDEIGFLTLYFARFQEIQRKPVKAVIMCTTGIGTSELLKSKLENNFPYIDIIGLTNYQDFTFFKKEYPEIELLISTVSIASDNSLPIVLVSAMLTEEDKRRLKDCIRAINYDK